MTHYKLPQSSSVQEEMPITLLQLTWGGGMGGSSWKVFAKEFKEIDGQYHITTYDGVIIEINPHWVVYKEPNAKLLVVRNRGLDYVLLREKDTYEIGNRFEYIPKPTFANKH